MNDLELYASKIQKEELGDEGSCGRVKEGTNPTAKVQGEPEEKRKLDEDIEG